MAITLEQQRLANPDPLAKGVIQILERTNDILQRLSFREIQGNSYTYRVEDEAKLGSVQFRSVNEGYTEDTAEFIRRTAQLSILGGEAFVDRFLIQSSPLADLRSEQLSIKTRLMGRKFTEEFMNGNATENPEGFDGLTVLTPAEQTMDMAGAELTLPDLQELLDLCPNANTLITSRTGKRSLQRIFDLHPSYLSIGVNSFGEPVEQFAGIPIVAIDDTLLPTRDLELEKVNDFYLVDISDTGVMGIQNGNGISVRDLGEIDERPGFLTRVEWYVSIMAQNTKSTARITNAVQLA